MTTLLAILVGLCLLSALFTIANLLEFRKVDARRTELLRHMDGGQQPLARQHRSIIVTYVAGAVLLSVALLSGSLFFS